ncbi:D-glycero-alpha-D-manno-heptose-1,7-bisphosphate 7-phosphatase [Telmatobacter bradus]|uniref:D-glycero-alpha-D-manno-heptose-1,7-bisphosphate 7-phosphatase n=1 Tax=Telmatobacter bradus TaxID=474953 RepID=UPI003B42CBF1
MNPDQSISFSAPLRTVFLDRDGVLNRKLPEDNYVTCWEEFSLLPGVPEAIARLNAAGLLTVVVTNQRGVARGRSTLAGVEAVHERLQQELAAYGAHLDGFFICPHDKKQCDCRKPLPGLFHQAQQRFPQIEAVTSLMIGDSLGDIEFGRILGMQTICVAAGEHPSPAAEEAAKLATARAGSLAEAVDLLLRGLKAE